MGLDVYLYKLNKPIKEVRKLKALCEKRQERVWKGKNYDKLPEAKRKELHEESDKIEADMKINELETEIQLKSKKHPDFELNYIRSSYNSGGTNHVLGDAIGKDLYWIFNRKRESEYEFSPNWKESKKRCEQALKEFKKVIEKTGGCYAMDVESHGFLSDAGPNDVLETYSKHLIREGTRINKNTAAGFGAYSCKEGQFFLNKPLRVRAIIPGKGLGLTDKGGFSNRDTMYLVVENESKFDWYIEQLEVISEMCDWVLEQKGDFVLHWSS